MTVRFLSRASREVADAVRYYEAQQSGLGSRFLAELDQVLEFIEVFPAASPKVHGQVRRALLRRFPFGVLYRKSNGEIVVAAVMDLRRDPADSHPGIYD